MHCRAYLLLEREYRRITTNPEWGIEVSRSESNIFCWYATMHGLNGSIWENGFFHITIQFNENFDDEPPVVKFNTIPFHPNIDPFTGEPCIDHFTGSTRGDKSGISVIALLISLQTLLSNPNLDEAVNTEAANLLQTAPHIYMQVVKNCVSESAKLIGALKGQDLEDVSKENGKLQFVFPKKAISSTDSYTRRPKQVSFDEYHKNWVQLASSQPLATIPLSQSYATVNGVVFMRGTDHNVLHSSMRPRTESVSPLAVSKTVVMDTEQKLNKMRQKKVQRITAMRQLYLNNTDEEKPGTIVPVSSRTDILEGSKNAELWEKEADELVAWTTTLEESSV